MPFWPDVRLHFENSFLKLGGLTKTNLACSDTTIFETCPKAFHGQKIKVNFFFDGKSKGPLLARAALRCMVVTYKAFS